MSTNAKKIYQSRQQAIKRIKEQKKKMKVELDDPKVKAKMERLAQKAEDRKIIVLHVPTDCIFPDAVRTTLTDLTTTLNTSSFILNERNLSNMGRLLFGVELLNDGCFSEIPDFAQQVENLDAIIMFHFNAETLTKLETKLKSAYANLKETLKYNYENIPESQRERILNNEMKYMKEYRFGLLTDEEKLQYAEEAAKREELERLEREAAAQKFREERLAEIEKEKQEKIAKEIARRERDAQKEISRQETLSEYLNNPDDFWNTPDPVKSKSRRRSNRTKK